MSSSIVRVLLPSGAVMLVESPRHAGESPEERATAGASIDRGPADIANRSAFDIGGVLSTLEQLSTSVMTAVQKARPSKATIEFGIEVSVEAGALTALLVSGDAKGNLKVTLEWSPSTSGHPLIEQVEKS